MRAIETTGRTAGQRVVRGAGRSQLGPAVAAAARWVWRTRWTPAILCVLGVATAGRAFVIFSQRATHFVAPNAAADAADHPFRYANTGAAASSDAFMAGVQVVLFVVAAALLLVGAMLASRDR